METQATDNPVPVQDQAVVKALLDPGVALAVATAIGYFAGCTVLSGYFDVYGLRHWDLDLSISRYLFYSVVFGYLAWLLIVPIIALGNIESSRFSRAVTWTGLLLLAWTPSALGGMDIWRVGLGAVAMLLVFAFILLSKGLKELMLGESRRGIILARIVVLTFMAFVLMCASRAVGRYAAMRTLESGAIVRVVGANGVNLSVQGMGDLRFVAANTSYIWVAHREGRTGIQTFALQKKDVQELQWKGREFYLPFNFVW